MLLLLPLVTVGNAAAQTVHRCVDARGERVYADRACRFLGLTEQAPRADSGSAAHAPPGVATAPDDSGPVPAADGCPGPTPEALRDALLAAIATRDLNALTGMYYWAGAGRGAANGVIGRMQDLISSAPRSAELQPAEASDDWLWAGLPPPTEPGPPQLVLRAHERAFDPVARFQLRRQAGCYWLSAR